MKIRFQSHPRRGMVSLPAVISVGLLMMVSMVFVFRSQLQSVDVQAQTQLKLDYAQKEEAFLQALLHIVPNKAIGAMQRGSAFNPDDFNWETIFQEAANLANLEEAIDANLLLSLGKPDAIVANGGDTTFGSVSNFIKPVHGTSGFVNPGLTQEVSLLFDGVLGSKLPAPLTSSNSVFREDEIWPIITSRKTHSTGWTAGIGLSPADYPDYNLHQYPNIRFGYARPGEQFVAKRNWWAFQLNLADVDQVKTGIGTVTRNYVLSIYEIPSQLPLSASAFMSVGQHADGTTWNDADLDGGVFAGRLQTEGYVDVDNGTLAARSELDLSASTTVDGQAIADNFDSMGVRERREAQTESEFYEASIAGNVGRAVFIPLNRGDDFLDLQGDGPGSERLSPTGWNTYTTGGVQAEMRIRIREMDSVDNQVPTELRFYYRNTSGARVYRTYTRGSTWPSDSQTGGTEIPFQTDTLGVGRRAIIFHADRLPAFLASLGDAEGVDVNNSIYIYPDSRRSTVNEPQIPSTSDDLAVALRGGEDMSAYTTGFSMVTNMRLYIGSSLNTTAIPIPAGSGLDSGEILYPPLSLFAPEKRFGISTSFSHPIEFAGQISTLKDDNTDVFRPLDFKGGSDDAVNPDLIEADLRKLKSPAQLPPIMMMNWLVVVEEIF